jgi:hypothetical protein
MLGRADLTSSLVLMQSCQSVVDEPKSLATGICAKNGEFRTEYILIMYNK